MCSNEEKRSGSFISFNSTQSNVTLKAKSDEVRAIEELVQVSKAVKGECGIQLGEWSLISPGAHHNIKLEGRLDAGTGMNCYYRDLGSEQRMC